MNLFQKNIIDKYNQLDYDDQVIFMNDGYLEIDEYFFPNAIQPQFKLNNKNAFFRYQAHLYYKTLIESNVYEGTYLDLSCGRGGGVDFVKDNFKFDKIYGIDINPIQIEFCEKWCNGIEFKVGSATSIPLSNESVNIITSIEAFSYYNPYDLFFLESHRILKKNGVIAIAVPSQNPPLYNSKKMNQLFDIIKIVDITKNVSLACSMSKYIIPQHLNQKKTKFDTQKILFNEELRYLNNQRKYIILILKKKENL